MAQLPREVVGSLSLEVIQNYGVELLWWVAVVGWVGVGLGDPSGLFQPEWFCGSI